MNTGENISWEEPVELEGWEPWEDYEPDEREDAVCAGACAYCGEREVRERPEPFGGQKCCEGCFNELIGGERDDPPWRCGSEGIQEEELQA